MPIYNFLDKKCVFGYMSVCVNCLGKVPSHVDTSVKVSGFPEIQCGLCGRVVDRLEEWSVVEHPHGVKYNLYLPPESQVKCLNGFSVNRQKRVLTSPIKHFDRVFKEVTTETGSIYTLGEPDVNFVNFCKKKNLHVPTREEPFK